MTPHVARGYYGGAVVLFWSVADASSEEQGIVDRGCRHRRGCRRPSGGGPWRAVRTDEGASPNRNALVVDRRACPVRPGRHERRESRGGRDQQGGWGARPADRNLQ